MRRAAPGHGDAGGIVLGWLTKLVVVLSLAGVVAFDAISIGASRLSVEDQAHLAARESSMELDRTRDAQLAYNVAVATAVESHALNEVPPSTFAPAPDGTVSLELHRVAATLVVHRVPWIADWAHVSARAAANGLG